MDYGARQRAEPWHGQVRRRGDPLRLLRWLRAGLGGGLQRAAAQLPEPNITVRSTTRPRSSPCAARRSRSPWRTWSTTRPPRTSTRTSTTTRRCPSISRTSSRPSRRCSTRHLAHEEPLVPQVERHGRALQAHRGGAQEVQPLPGWAVENDYARARDIINARRGQHPVEVPYMFCSDYEVGANLLCNRNDQGADVFEMTSKWMERFNQSYVFSNFRRDRSSTRRRRWLRQVRPVPREHPQRLPAVLFNIFYLAKYYQLTPRRWTSTTASATPSGRTTGRWR